MRLLLGCVLILLLASGRLYAGDGDSLIGHLQAEPESSESRGPAQGVATVEPGPDGIVLRIFAADLVPDREWDIVVHEFGDLSSPEGSSLGAAIDVEASDGDEERKFAGNRPGVVRVRSDAEGVIVQKILLSPPENMSVGHWLGRGISLQSAAASDGNGEKKKIVLKGVFGQRNPESDPFLRLKEMRDFSRYRARLQV